MKVTKINMADYKETNKSPFSDAVWSEATEEEKEIFYSMIADFKSKKLLNNKK